jgi:magnesium transporter
MRRKLLSKISHKAGLPPGTLLHIGEKHASPVRLQLVDYSPDHLEERKLKSSEECRPYRHSPSVSWINLDGVHRTELLEQMGAVFDLHPLVQEDIVNTDHRPKLEEFDDYLFVVLKMPYYDARQTMIHTEQVSLVLGGRLRAVVSGTRRRYP